MKPFDEEDPDWAYVSDSKSIYMCDLISPNEDSFKISFVLSDRDGGDTEVKLSMNRHESGWNVDVKSNGMKTLSYINEPSNVFSPQYTLNSALADWFGINGIESDRFYHNFKRLDSLIRVYLDPTESE